MSNKVDEIMNEAFSEGRTFLLEPEAKEVCQIYGIPVTKFKVARSREEAVRFAEEIGYPVVLKIVSPDVIHKTDIGGVVVDVKNSKQVLEVYDRIIKNVKSRKADAKISGILIQEMAPDSTEVVVGEVRDPQFGPSIMFGLGGIFVEILKDVSFRIVPLTERDAREMIGEIKGYPILASYRGQPPSDVDSIVDIILRVSCLVSEHPEINQLDLNPIFVYSKGAKVIDAMIILKKP